MGVVKAFHNRHRVLRGELLVNQWREEYSMVNEPFLKVELEALPSDAYEGELQTNIDSARQKVSIDAARKSLHILHPDFADASRYPPSTARRLPCLHLRAKPPVKGLDGLQLLPVRVD